MYQTHYVLLEIDRPVVLSEQQWGGECNESYGDSELGGWSQKFFVRQVDFSLLLQIFYNTCGIFIIAADVLTKDLTRL